MIEIEIEDIKNNLINNIAVSVCIKLLQSITNLDDDNFIFFLEQRQMDLLRKGINTNSYNKRTM